MNAGEARDTVQCYLFNMLSYSKKSDGSGYIEVQRSAGVRQD